MFKKILISFLTWRFALFLIAFLSIYIFSSFGDRFPYADRVLTITHLPYWIWGWGNFDGVHYLRIAQDGYVAQYSQAFFPVFPFLIKVFSYVFPRTINLNINLYVDPSFFYSGVILSNLFFLTGLYLFFKLILIDFKSNIAFTSVIFLLVLPTSFYFGAIYTESLFFLLCVAAIYLIRKNKFFWGVLLISITTATRITGILLIPLYLIEAYKSKNKMNLLWSLITPAGILLYMYYLKVNFSDPILFLTSQPFFGASRSSSQIILLPQVIYRYVKIFMTINFFSLPYFNAILEVLSTLIPLAILIVLIKKIRFSYWFFSIITLLLGTLTGTLSSMPRYSLVVMALVLPSLVQYLGKYTKTVMVILGVLEALLAMLFIRGYWVA